MSNKYGAALRLIGFRHCGRTFVNPSQLPKTCQFLKVPLNLLKLWQQRKGTLCVANPFNFLRSTGVSRALSLPCLGVALVIQRISTSSCSDLLHSYYFGTSCFQRWATR
jgi:hypothetical protein